MHVLHSYTAQTLLQEGKVANAIFFPPTFFRLVSLVLLGREESWLSVSLTGGSPLTL